MIKQVHVRAGEFFQIPHPDVPGSFVTTIVDDVFGPPFAQKVRHHSPEVVVPSPSELKSFAERASYPVGWQAKLQTEK